VDWSRPECSAAASAYRATLVGCLSVCTDLQRQTLRAQGARFDATCLRAVDETPLPRVAGGAQAALRATALIEAAGAHLCGGLFLSSTRLLTAAHCFESTPARMALKRGEVWARSADGAIDRRWRLAPRAEIPTTSAALGNDHLELDVIDGDLATSPIAFARPVAFASAFVPGYFNDRDPARRLSAPRTAPEQILGLRWTDPRSCIVVDSEAGCLSFICQTAPGFSGGPIFAATNTDNLTVYGLVSRSGSRVRCGTMRVSGLNFASIPDPGTLR
jgi:Trypsin